MNYAEFVNNRAEWRFRTHSTCLLVVGRRLTAGRLNAQPLRTPMLSQKRGRDSIFMPLYVSNNLKRWATEKNIRSIRPITKI